MTSKQKRQMKKEQAKWLAKQKEGTRVDPKREAALNAFLGKDITQNHTPSINGLSAQVLVTPAGMSNENEGICNAVMYGPTGDLPMFSDNTARGVGYVAAKQSFGSGKLKEYQIVWAKQDGSELNIMVVAKKKPTNAEAAAYVSGLQQSLPEKARKLVIKTLVGICQTTVRLASETPHQYIGLVPYHG